MFRHTLRTPILPTLALLILVGFILVSSINLSNDTLVLGSQQTSDQLITSPIRPQTTFNDLLPEPHEIPTIRADTLDPQITAESAIVIDQDTLTPLFQKNSHAPRYPASTTKLATALVALQTYQLDETLTVPSDILVQTSGSSAHLLAKDTITVRDLMFALLIGSANDAAYTLAVNHPNGYDRFINLMNELAQNLRLSSTTYQNPIGFDQDNHTTSAFDLAILTHFALREPLIRTIVSTPTYTFTSSVKPKQKYSVFNTNQLLNTVEGVTGVKTGWTPLAQGLHIASVDRNDHRIIVVVVNSTTREIDSETLINWTYESYEWK